AETLEEIGRSAARSLALGTHLARLQESIGLQISALRHDIQSQCRALAQETARQGRDTPTTAAPSAGCGQARSGFGALILLIVSALLIITSYWLYNLYTDTEANLRNTGAALATLHARDIHLRNRDDTRLAQAATQDEMDARRRQGLLLDALQWALNRDTTFGYDQVALGDPQVRILRILVARLAASGFQGTIRLNVHFARFCLARAADGTLRLAPDATPVSACDEIGYARAHSPDLAGDESLGFAAFLTGSPLLQNSGIRVQAAVAKDTAPQDNSAEQQAAQTAGEWNRVASRYNRVAIVLIPERGATPAPGHAAEGLMPRAGTDAPGNN
ncbi:MAG: hypothetical protein ACYC18_03595, partial [Gammaproteobacteria bacterium]